MIVYSVTDIACENRERMVEFEAIMDADSVCITRKNPEPVVEPGTSMDNKGAGIYDTCRNDEVLDGSIHINCFLLRYQIMWLNYFVSTHVISSLPTRQVSPLSLIHI